MSPNRRKRKNRDLPPNLEVDPKGKVTYYRYVFATGKRRSLGRNRAIAVEVARQLNETLTGKESPVEQLLKKHKRMTTYSAGQ